MMMVAAVTLLTGCGSVDPAFPITLGVGGAAGAFVMHQIDKTKYGKVIAALKAEIQAKDARIGEVEAENMAIRQLLTKTGAELEVLKQKIEAEEKTRADQITGLTELVGKRDGQLAEANATIATFQQAEKTTTEDARKQAEAQAKAAAEKLLQKQISEAVAAAFKAEKARNPAFQQAVSTPKKCTQSTVTQPPAPKPQTEQPKLQPRKQAAEECDKPAKAYPPNRRNIRHYENDGANVIVRISAGRAADIQSASEASERDSSDIELRYQQQ